MSIHVAFAKRRFGACGESSRLGADAAAFCEAIGAAVMKRDNVLLVTSGARGADSHYVKGARDALRGTGMPEHQRIETVVLEAGETNHFTAGRTFNARGRTRESRRFAFINRLEVLVAVSGGKGTRQNLRLAGALDLPVLPIPIFGGEAQTRWNYLRKETQSDKRYSKFLDDAEAIMSSRSVTTIASELVDLLLSRLKRRCFVITPFRDEAANALCDDCIAPALERLGHEAIHLDRMRVPGNASTQIEEGIANADYVIAVLDGATANVFYEIGLAHGLGRPTFLLKRRTTGSELPVPFDVVTQQRLEYEDSSNGEELLFEAIQTLEQHIPGTRD